MDTAQPVFADLYFMHQQHKESHADADWAWILVIQRRVIAVLTVRRGRSVACDGTSYPPRAVVSLLCGTRAEGRVTPPLIEYATKHLESEYRLKLFRSGKASPRGLRALENLLEVDPVAVHNTERHDEPSASVRYFCEWEVRTMEDDEVERLEDTCDLQLSEAQYLFDNGRFRLLEENVILPRNA
ncbi:hypothetical protein [Rhodococcus gordoniae]|uniref:hypothetical protein n=1 Tax=Rhodococcus gordoniae TaxID=223392 RepID=UPI0020CCA140|nr:hypothetical protein [Rhodococcus gordoniae]UTT48885.1 hypothetical protein NMQ04_01300 [Rhodococcus gordoniae]